MKKVAGNAEQNILWRFLIAALTTSSTQKIGIKNGKKKGKKINITAVKIKNNMPYPQLINDEESDLNNSATAGHLHQIATETVKKELEKICDEYGLDMAYWDFEIILKFTNLTSNFEPNEITTVTFKSVINKNNPQADT